MASRGALLLAGLAATVRATGDAASFEIVPELPANSSHPSQREYVAIMAADQTALPPGTTFLKLVIVDPGCGGATPDPIPEEGQKRALELMKSGALFRYTPGVESETALARAAVSIKRPHAADRRPIFGPPGLGGGRARLLAPEERALILTRTLTLTLRRRSGT